LEVCEARDVKGLYKKAREGKIKNFTGIDAPFETPLHPDMEIRTDVLSIQDSVNKVLEYILPKIKYNSNK
jgi:adenylylsulfate kinase